MTDTTERCTDSTDCCTDSTALTRLNATLARLTIALTRLNAVGGTVCERCLQKQLVFVALVSTGACGALPLEALNH